MQCMEIADEVQMQVINGSGGTSRTWKETPTLFFKFSGTPGQVTDSIQRTQTLVRLRADGFEFAETDEEARTLWSARKEALWSTIAFGGDHSSIWTTDVAVPISKLPDIIGKCRSVIRTSLQSIFYPIFRPGLTHKVEISKKELDELGVFAGIIGHIGDGNFHEFIVYNKQNKDEKQRVEHCVHNMVERALEMEGSCTVSELHELDTREALVFRL